MFIVLENTTMNEVEFTKNYSKIKNELGMWFFAHGTTEEVVSKLKRSIKSLVENQLSYDLSTDFYHVKLTLDLENMRVIEQSSIRIE